MMTGIVKELFCREYNLRLALKTWETMIMWIKDYNCEQSMCGTCENEKCIYSHVHPNLLANKENMSLPLLILWNFLPLNVFLKSLKIHGCWFMMINEEFKEQTYIIQKGIMNDYHRWASTFHWILILLLCLCQSNIHK